MFFVDKLGQEYGIFGNFFLTRYFKRVKAGIRASLKLMIAFSTAGKARI